MITKDEIQELLHSTETYRVERTAHPDFSVAHPSDRHSHT